MANSITMNCTLKTVADVKDVISNVESIQKVLNQLKLPDSLKTNFTKIFSDLEKNGSKAVTALESGFKTKGSVSSYENALNQINGLLIQLQKNMGKVTTEDLQNSLEVDPAQLKAAQDEVKRLQDLLSQNIQAGGLDKISQKLKELKNDTHSSAKSFEGFDEVLKQGNFDEAARRLQNLANGFSRLKDADKKNEALARIQEISNAIEQLKNAPNISQILQDLDTAQTNLSELNATELEKVEQTYRQIIESLQKMTQETLAYSDSDVKAAHSQNQLNSELDQLKNKVGYFFGLNNAVQLFQRALRDAYETVKDLDKVMTETAVVTDFSVGDMWKQLPEYTKRANELGVSIHSVYEAATLYYQQGLKTNEVVAISNETLKMARIAGLDASESTDRMTNALRGFNMEINQANAQNIADVYSKLAAITASNVDEISTAMTKTASLASNANMSFENTAAFLSQIIETTRESAETAGTALKTVIARFSEVKKLYSEGELLGTDTEGEAIDVNKIATALKTAGINLNEFLVGSKGLDEIFIELASKWDSLTTIQQRYIATMAAGSRQQSRFIALMSNYKRTTELVGAANDAAGASQKQYEKTLDSLESKLNRLENAWNSFIMGIADNEVIKGAIDLLTSLITAINKMTDSLPGALNGLGKLGIVVAGLKLGKPVAEKALSNLGTAFLGKSAEIGKESGESLLKSFIGSFKTNRENGKVTLNSILNGIGDKFTVGIGLQFNEEEISKLTERLKGMTNVTEEQFDKLTKLIRTDATAASKDLEALGVDMKDIGPTQASIQKASEFGKKLTIAGTAAAATGVALMGVSNVLRNKGNEKAADVIQALGVGLTGVSVILPIVGKLGLKAGAEVAAGGQIAQVGWGWIALIGVAIAAVVGGIAYLVSTYESAEDKAERLEKQAKEAQQAAIEAKNEYDELLSSQTEYNTLISQVEELTKGTTQWKEAIAKVNEETLKLLSMYDILDGYATLDENGMYTISDAGWDALLKQQQDKIRTNQYKVFGSQLESNKIRREQILENLPVAPVLTQNISGNTVTAFYRKVQNLEEAQQVYQDLLTRLGVGVDFKKQYEYYQNEIEDYLNNEFKSSSIKTILAQNFEGSEFLGTIATALTNTLDLGTDLITKEVQGLSENDLKQAYKKATGIDIDTLSKDSRPDTKEMQAVVEGAKLTERVVNRTEQVLRDAQNNSALAALLAGDLDINLDKRNQREFGEASSFWLDLYTQQQQRRFDLDSEFSTFFGQSVSDLGLTYNVADELSIKFAQIKENLPDIVVNFQELITTSTKYKDANGLQTLADDLSNINFNDPINGARQLKELIDSFDENDSARGTFERILNDPFFSQTSQVNAAYRRIKTSLEDLRKSGKITGEQISDLAKDNKDLATVLDNTGLSVYTLADYFDKLVTHEIEAAAEGTNFIEVLNRLRATANAEQGAFDFVRNAEWRSTDSTTELHKGIQELREAFEELYDLGAYDDRKMQQILTDVFGDAWMEHPMQSIKILKNLFDQATDTMYGFWTAYISIGSKNNLDAIRFSEDGRSLEIVVDQLDDTETLIKDITETLGVSRGFAEAMFTDLINMSDGAREAFERLDIKTSELKTALNSKQIGQFFGISKNELKNVANILGISADQLQGKLNDVFGSTFFLVDDFTKDNVTEQIRDSIFNSIRDGIDKGHDVVVDFVDAKNWMIELGMNPEEAQTVINDLITNTKKEFSNIDLEITENSINYTKTVIDTIGAYLENQIELGIDSGFDNAKDAAADFTTIAGKSLSKALFNGLKEGTGKGFDYAKQALDAYSIYALKREKYLSEQKELNTLQTQLEAAKISLRNVLKRDKNDPLMAALADELIDTYTARVNLLTPIVETLSKQTENTWAEMDSTDQSLKAILDKANQDLVLNPQDDFPPDEQKDKWDELLDEINKLKQELGLISNYGKETLTAYTTGPARATGDDKSKDKDTGKTSPEKKIYYESPYTELDNINEALAEQLRQRTKLERQYNEVLKRQTSTMQDIRKAYQDQIDGLEKEKQLQERRMAEAMAQLNALGTRRYFDSEGNASTFEKMGATQYAQYNFQTNEVTIDWQALYNVSDKETGDAAEKYISYLRQISQELEDAIDSIDDIEDNIEDIQQQSINTYLSFEERVLDAVVGKREREIDTLEKGFNALNKSTSKMLSALQQQINLDRQNRQNQDIEQSIADKEARLAYLRRDTSGANQLEILQLEKELEQDRQNYSDSLVDQALNQLQTEADEAAQQREEQIQIMRDQLEAQVANGELWDEVHRLINEAIGPDGTFRTDSELMDLLKEQENFNAMSLSAQYEYIEKASAAFREAIAGAGAVDEKWGAGTSGINVPPPGSESEVPNSSDLGGSSEGAGNKPSLTDTQLRELAVTIAMQDFGWNKSGWGTEYASKLSGLLKADDITKVQSYINQFRMDANNMGAEEAISDWGYRGLLSQWWRTAADQYLAGYSEGTQHGSSISHLLDEVMSEYYYSNFSRKYNRYKKGGLVSETGPAWLDGTNANPEMVLSAADTKNFISLRDILAQLAGSGLTSGGDNYYDIDISAEIGSDYDVDQLAARIKKQITDNASYRNVNAISFIR